MGNEKEYSAEAITAMEMVESLPESQRGQMLDWLRSAIEDAQEITSWDETLDSNMDKLRRLAQKARADHRAGKTTPMDF